MPKPNESAARRIDEDASAVEPGMEDILRSIRGILGEEEERRVEFPDSSANDPGEDLPPRRQPPLAFLQRKRAPEVMEPIEADAPAAKPVVPSLEERLARHREKAEAERRTLRELTERAQARVAPLIEEPTPPAPEAVEKREAPAEPIVAEVAPEPVVEPEPAPFVSEQELFDATPVPEPVRRPRRMALPEIEAEPVDYAGPAQRVELFSPEPAAAGLDETFEDLARSMLQEKSGEMDGVLADMMRPMVREWLDDNLAAIVERVVREEIERVSRGAR